MTPSPLPVVELLSKPECHLCMEVKQLLHTLQASHAFTLREINLAEHEALCAQFGEEIPVVFINGHKAFKYRIDAKQFVRRLQRTQRAGQSVWSAWRWKKGD